MIKTVEIQNFKSIKKLKLNARRVNLFIGEPNTGKSNLLEALGVFSILHTQDLNFFLYIKDTLRFNKMYDLFFEEDIKNSPMVKIDGDVALIYFSEGPFVLRLKFNKGETYKDTMFKPTGEPWGGSEAIFNLKGKYKEPPPIKFYRFAGSYKFPSSEPGFLLPPHGENLPVAILTNKRVRSFISEILEPFGLKLSIKQVENEIEVLRAIEDITVSYPYNSVSDTLQRIIFYFAAMLSNKNSTLVLEEPEAHSFPFYTKFLAERIGLDPNRNQYFITTHNPYFLISIVEKTKSSDLAVFVTYMRDYQTKVKALNKSEIEQLLDYGSSVFFNIDRFLDREK